VELTCPLPLQYEQIVMAHGGGGRLMQQLLARVVQPTAYVGVSLKRTPTFFIICMFVGIRTSSQPTIITSKLNDNTQSLPQHRYLL
jgi:hypothetical protein